jgi:hypothetical protein
MKLLRASFLGLPDYKPVSVSAPSLPKARAVVIPLGRESLPGSSDLPGSCNGAGRSILPYLVLLRMGFALPAHITAAAVRSYRTFSPLLRLDGTPPTSPRPDRRRSDGSQAGYQTSGIVFCGTFRKARFERALPAVSRHVALWRPDFPPASSGCPVEASDYPSGRPRVHYGSVGGSGARRTGGTGGNRKGGFKTFLRTSVLK